MATPQQVQRRGRWSLILGTILAALTVVAAAYADNTEVDGDGLAPISQAPMAFGNVSCGQESKANALIAISRNGSATGTNTFKNGAVLTISVVSVSGSGVSASVPASPGNQITLPSNWTSLGNNDLSSSIMSEVKVNSSTVGTGSGTVKYRATGLNTSNQVITRDADMSVSWTTGSCTPPDTTAPTASPTQSPAANGGWNNTDVTVTWNWSDNTGGSGIDAANCTTSSTSSGEGTLTLAATCKDVAGNVGSASHTVKIDKTAPTATATASPAANSNGWNNTDVTVSFNGSDGAGSGIASCSTDVVLSSEGANQSASGTCTDVAGNVSAAATLSGINIDKTAPTAAAAASPAANSNGWNNTDVTVSFNGSDAGGSGIAFCTPAVTLSSEGIGLSASGNCTDLAGNVSALASKTGINIDKTAPTNVTFVGGPAAGGNYYFGSVPAEPTCTADGAISGLTAAGCTVSGYSETVGSKTMTASATDLAGNTGTAARSYTVLAWTLSGFFQPVDMGTNVFNTVKSGATVPLKFRVFAGSTELTDVSAVTSLSYVKITCAGVAIEDAIEEIAPTGGTLLRYDSTGGQFVYNLKTSGKAGDCYRATMTAQDGSKIEANFKLK